MTNELKIQNKFYSPY